jgi:hypothetical protein
MVGHERREFAGTSGSSFLPARDVEGVTTDGRLPPVVMVVEVRSSEG